MPLFCFMYYVILLYFIDTSFIQMYVNCSIFYILYILSIVYICDFMHMYFVRNDEIKMFNQSIYSLPTISIRTWYQVVNDHLLNKRHKRFFRTFIKGYSLTAVFIFILTSINSVCLSASEFRTKKTGSPVLCSIPCVSQGVSELRHHWFRY